MPNSAGKKIVVDSNVARSAGNVSDIPISGHSRDALLAILNRKHLLVLNEPFEAEWKKHESRFAKSWRVTMQQRGRICWIASDEFGALARRLGEIEEANFPKDALLKDMHVFACALATDRIVVSNESRLKKHLLRLAAFETSILLLSWASPNEEGKDCAIWLRAGAKFENARTLAKLNAAANG